jgi:DNA-binding NtrC family response regulator
MVDDEASIRLTLGAMLTRAGYEVTSAGDGEEAVALLERQAFDLLLVDLKMPGMGGMQVVTAARRRQPDIAVIVLTGHGSLDTAIEGIHQDVFDYLLKTAEPPSVVDRVKAALGARAQALRQHTLFDVVGTAVQELRGGSQAAEVEPDGPAERLLVVGALQLDSWRQEATLGAAR